MELHLHSQDAALSLPSIPLQSVRRPPLKRAFDLLCSLMLLTLLSPVFLLVALAVKLSSKGPILYVQKRVGRAGRLFHCYKFRTMHDNAEALLEELLTTHPSMRAEWERNRKLTADPRVTPLGRLLRRTALDELPQLFNVLRGDLSMVGPRPVCPDEITRYYRAAAPKLLSVRPGMTGAWQIANRHNRTYKDRVAMDLGYIENQSFFGDLVLILKTVPAILWSTSTNC